MEQSRIDEIRARCEAATPGPWEHRRTRNYAEIHNTDTWGKMLTPIALVGYDDDADFIAHSRQDVPDLLAEVERLELESMKFQHSTECLEVMIEAEKHENEQLRAENEAMRAHICCECQKVCDQCYHGQTPCGTCHWYVDKPKPE